MRRNGLELSLFAVIVVLALIAGAFFVSYRFTGNLLERVDLVSSSSAPQGEGVAVPFMVRKGEGARDIGERLQAAGLVRSAALFHLLVTYYGVGSKLEAGDYELSPNLTVTQIISKLQHGLVKSTLVTIPEGWRLEQAAQALDQQGVFPKGDFLAAGKTMNTQYWFLDPKEIKGSLEGYLFPDTYQVAANAKPDDLIKQMLDNFGSKFTDGMRRQAQFMNLSIHQLVTLASIVEREAVVPEERPLIAGVFLNRLRQEMPLQADPTVQYALASDPTNVANYGFWKLQLTTSDLEVGSSYNTYKRVGLPPGPICSPGLSSIKAVLEATPTNYLYFVARGDGSHVFARTYEEHVQNVRLYSGR